MTFNPNDLEVFSFLAGLGLGVLPRFGLAFRITIFMLQVINWWIKTHPTGMKMAYETDLDDDFYRLFGVELEKHGHLFNGHKEELIPEKYLSIGEAAKFVNRKVGTLRLWDTQGKLKPSAKGKNGYRRYRMSDLEQFAKNN